MPNREGHTPKIELDFDDVQNSGSLNYLDGKTAYNLGMCVGAFNTRKCSAPHLSMAALHISEKNFDFSFKHLMPQH
ncbi:MAG: hypothetical protein GY718_11930 [Lentisphaerae bacterium]|nr:hypothetical protein [Lentisphaerota bacterium]